MGSLRGRHNWAKGTFHAKMGSIKDRNGMDLTEAEDIKKRWHRDGREAASSPGMGAWSSQKLE